MKITIDYKLKTIQVQDCENISDMFEQIQISLPMGEWRKYKLIDTIAIQKEYIYNDRTIWPSQQYIPTIQPYNPYPITYGGTSSGYIGQTTNNAVNGIVASNITYTTQCNSGSVDIELINCKNVNELQMILQNQNN